MTIEELKAKAKELEIEIDDDDNVDEDDLKEKIEDKEKEIADAKKKEELENDAEYLRGELKKVIGQRDTAKKDRNALKGKIKKLESQMSDLPDPDDVKGLKEELDNLREFKESIEKEKEEKELEKKSELEKQQVRHEKELAKVQSDYEAKMKEFTEKMEEFQKELEKSRSETEKFRISKLESEIVNEAANKDAFYPQQVYLLIKDKFQWDDDLGKFIMPVRDEKGKLQDEKDVKTAVDEFLSDPNNENLVKSNVNRGSLGTKHSNDDIKGSSKRRGGYDPKDPELIKEADLKGLEVEDLIDINIKRDEKMKKVKGEDEKE